MAETKRNTSAGKIATPKASGGQPQQLTQDTLEALGNAIGARIKLTTTNPASKTIEGVLFTACPLLNVVAVNTAPAPPNPSSSLAGQVGDYHVVPISKISSFSVLGLANGTTDAGSGSGSGAVSIGPVDTKRLRAREEDKVRKLKDDEAKRGKGVSAEGQAIYNALDRMYPNTRWHGTDIVVDNAVIIHAPYTSDAAKAPREKQQALDRIKMILDGERRKMERARNAGSAPPVGPRKGG